MIDPLDYFVVTLNNFLLVYWVQSPRSDFWQDALCPCCRADREAYFCFELLIKAFIVEYTMSLVEFLYNSQNALDEHTAILLNGWPCPIFYENRQNSQEKKLGEKRTIWNLEHIQKPGRWKCPRQPLCLSLTLTGCPLQICGESSTEKGKISSYWSYRILVGEVELSRVFEDEMLASFPVRILVLQINPEAFDVFDSCTNESGASAVHPTIARR